MINLQFWWLIVLLSPLLIIGPRMIIKAIDAEEEKSLLYIVFASVFTIISYGTLIGAILIYGGQYIKIIY